MKTVSLALALGLGFAASAAQAATLLATATLTRSSAGANADLSGQKGVLENGAPANMLGGIGSAMAWAGGTTFLALPDRGPNAVEFNKALDDTVSYIARVETVQMTLTPAKPGAKLPLVLVPRLTATTLLWSAAKLNYGSGAGMGNRKDGKPIGSGAAVNTAGKFYFTGRSDNFDPAQGSGDDMDARIDPEGLRMANDGKSVFVSDEYGPYVYQFDRATGRRLRSFKLPDNLYVAHKAPVGSQEVKGNTSGRTANRGMEGLAITPDGKTLVGIIQSPLLQDKGSKLLRLVRIDVASGTTQEFAYTLQNGFGVSEILALNDHEFLADDRDQTGLEGGDNATSTPAKHKTLVKFDIAGATDVTGMDAATALQHAVPVSPFLDLVQLLQGAGIAAEDIPSKIEGIAFGADVTVGGVKQHTLWIANDNDFLLTTGDKPVKQNPNLYYVIGITDADLGGSKLVPQGIR